MMKIGKAEEIEIFGVDEDGGDEDDIQIRWEKWPSPRKQSYPLNGPVGSSSTVSRGSNIDTHAGHYNDPAASYNVNMNCTCMAECRQNQHYTENFTHA